ncbi:MAG: endonuclease III [Planctomycetes bacterium]|nr:endonuclease III [Planctomycetota bacterium]
MTDAAVRKVLDVLSAHIVPKSDLVFASPFELLVAVALSAHTTDRSVNAATAQLFPIANTPQKILALGVDGVKPFIRPVGLYNAKSKNLIELCRILIESHGGDVPDSRESLEALPGVGRKTANVVLNIAFGHPTIAVDTHIHRVANRLGIARTRTPEQTEQVLLARTPKKHLLNAHHYLILHGRYCCIARRPECWRCPVARQCLFTPKTVKPVAG